MLGGWGRRHGIRPETGVRDRKLPAKVGFTLLSEPAADETIGLSVTGYASYSEDGEVHTFF